MGQKKAVFSHIRSAQLCCSSSVFLLLTESGCNRERQDTVLQAEKTEMTQGIAYQCRLVSLKNVFHICVHLVSSTIPGSDTI